MNTIEASPRGPNQPTNATVCTLACVPSSATATGSMRTTVRLSTPYSAVRQVRSTSTVPAIAAPKTRKVTLLASSPNWSRR